MRRLTFPLALLCLFAGNAGAAITAGSVGHGQGIILPGGDTNPCDGQLCLNFDGSAENGYCWQYGGIVPPYYGAFAECCDMGTYNICGIRLLLTGVGYPCGPFDAYVWADAGGAPGSVLSMTGGLNPCPVATWPSISTHDFAITSTPTSGVVWFGFWANNSTAPCGYFIAADTNGFGGCPYTNIAPGIGYPTGWNNVSAVWGPTQSIGIGAWFGYGPIIPIRETSWGRVKLTFE
jgi:hypothetical protein